MARTNHRCIDPAALAALLLTAPVSLVGQGTEEFVAAARRGTESYQDRSAAIAAGYRPMGPESPAMGQHWVHPGLLIQGVVDPARPQILSYATIAGRPVLVGVAYAVPTGARIPDGPAPREAWHVHDGTLVEEAVQPDHDAHRVVGAGPAMGGVAVLHAWIYVANPAGLFASDNWALPFVRLGLEPPARVPEATARALALAAGGVPFYVEQLGSTADLPGDAARTIERLLGARADTVGRWLASRPARPLDPAEIEWLTSLWTAAWSEARAAAGL
jgi:hypothetical protein